MVNLAGYITAPPLIFSSPAISASKGGTFNVPPVRNTRRPSHNLRTAGRCNRILIETPRLRVLIDAIRAIQFSRQIALGQKDRAESVRPDVARIKRHNYFEQGASGSIRISLVLAEIGLPVDELLPKY
jgi:hypothetical protein